MNKKLASMLFVSIFAANTLTGCGEEPATVPSVQPSGQPAATQTNTQSTTNTPAVTKTPIPTKTTTPAKTPTTTTGGKTPTTTTPATTTSAAPQTTASVAQKIVLKSKQTYDAYKNFTSSFSFYSKRNDKTAPSATAAVTGEFKYTFQNDPKVYLFTVIKHSISIAVGARLVWQAGEKQAKAKAAGALGLVTLTLDLSDSKLTTNRNWRLDQLEQASILDRASDPSATLAGKTTVNGKEAYIINVKGKALDDQVTEENISIDAKDFTLIADEMYAGKELIFQLKLKMENTNSALAADTFTL